MNSETIIKSEGITDGEKKVARLCANSFFDLWSYPNVHKSKGDELCDNLIIFKNNIIIISEKTNDFNYEGKDIDIVWRRWKKALLKSERQLKGAERWLKEHPDRVFIDAGCNIKLPIEIPAKEARFIKISVINGLNKVNQLREKASNEGLAIPSDMMLLSIDPSDIIHTLDEYTFPILLKELDTAEDFLSYFLQKEEFIKSGKSFPFFPEETDLLVMFLSNINKEGDKHCFFPDDFPNHDFIIIDNPQDPYPEFIKKEEYRRKKQANKISSIWDNLIKIYSKSLLERKLVGDLSFSEQIKIAEVMASECRYSRRLLSEYIRSFIDTFEPDYVRRGGVITPFNKEGVAYIFLQVKQEAKESYDEYRKRRCFLLYAYTLVFKKDNPKYTTILGIATEPPKYKKGSGSSEDYTLLQNVELSKEDIENACKYQEELNIFKNHKIYQGKHSPEYPNRDIDINSIQLKEIKVGRNEPCICGSGSKYKKCCGKA